MGRASSTTGKVKVAKIVIVDDDVDLAEELRDMLVGAGYSVETLSDSTKAAGLIRDLVPDVILLDLMMHGKDGLDVAGELAGDPKTAGIPIVIMTGFYTSDQLGFVSGVPGVRDVIIKPFSCEDVIERIDAVRRRCPIGQGPAVPAPAPEVS